MQEKEDKDDGPIVAEAASNNLAVGRVGEY
jgi:hypothetical protein